MSRNRFVVTLALSFLGAVAITALAADRKPIPVPSTPTAMTYKSLRGVQYCEVWLFEATQTAIDAHYYNTSGLNNSANKKDTCPPNMWAKVNADSLKANYDILFAFKNGPRGWTMDWATIPVGPVVNFDGVKSRWWGKGEMPKAAAEGGDLKKGLPPYKPLQSHRKSSMTFEKGKPVFILEDAEGTPWVMQAFGMIVDPTLTYDTLKNLGDKLKLAEGWKFRVAVLDKDLTISTPEGYNWIVQDDLGNTYDACKEGACNYKP